jgi:hypothetical protein
MEKIKKDEKGNFVEEPSSLPNEGLAEIKTFCLRVPIIEYDNDAELKLSDELFKNSYLFLFKKLQCIRKTKISGNELCLDKRNTYRNIHNPVWAFVVFQTNSSNNQEKDYGVFDHKNVKTCG